MVKNQTKKILFEKILIKEPFSIETWISYFFFETKRRLFRHAEKILLRAFFCLKRKENLFINIIFFQNFFQNQIFLKNLMPPLFFFLKRSLLLDIFFIINFFNGGKGCFLDFNKNGFSQKFDIRNIIATLFSINGKIGKPRVLNKLSEIIFRIGHIKTQISILDKIKNKFSFLKDNKRSLFIRKCIFHNFFFRKKKIFKSDFLTFSDTFIIIEKGCMNFSNLEKKYFFSLFDLSCFLWCIGFTQVISNKQKILSLKQKKKMISEIFLFFLRKLKFFLNFNFKNRVTFGQKFLNK